ncbi:MAG: hypothetical protein WCG05_02580 [Alphaproteobacteria bacterium]
MKKSFTSLLSLMALTNFNYTPSAHAAWGSDDEFFDSARPARTQGPTEKTRTRRAFNDLADLKTEQLLLKEAIADYQAKIVEVDIDILENEKKGQEWQQEDSDYVSNIQTKELKAYAKLEMQREAALQDGVSEEDSALYSMYLEGNKLAFEHKKQEYMKFHSLPRMQGLAEGRSYLLEKNHSLSSALNQMEEDLRLISTEIAERESAEERRENSMLSQQFSRVSLADRLWRDRGGYDMTFDTHNPQMAVSFSPPLGATPRPFLPAADVETASFTVPAAPVVTPETEQERRRRLTREAAQDRARLENVPQLPSASKKAQETEPAVDRGGLPLGDAKLPAWLTGKKKSVSSDK